MFEPRITYPFTYTYDAYNYPSTVHIHELKEAINKPPAEADLGTYFFEYY